MQSYRKIRAKPRPGVVYLLMALLFFLGTTALLGGYGLMANPSGEALGMSATWLAGTPFRSYFLPGLVLFFVLGVMPLVAVYVLWTKPVWTPMRGLESLTHHHWSWLAAVALGVTLLVWIAVQVVMLGLISVLQPLYRLLALLMIGVAFLPSVRHHYALKEKGIKK